MDMGGCWLYWQIKTPGSKYCVCYLTLKIPVCLGTSPKDTDQMLRVVISIWWYCLYSPIFSFLPINLYYWCNFLNGKVTFRGAQSFQCLGFPQSKSVNKDAGYASLCLWSAEFELDELSLFPRAVFWCVTCTLSGRLRHLVPRPSKGC